MSPTVKILLPTPLRMYADRQGTVEGDAATAGEALATLVTKHEALKRHLFDDAGKLRRYVNVYRNDEDIRHLEQEATPLGERDTLTIVPSIAGGTEAPPAAGAPPSRPAPPAWQTGAD